MKKLRTDMFSTVLPDLIEDEDDIARIGDNEEKESEPQVDIFDELLGNIPDTNGLIPSNPQSSVLVCYIDSSSIIHQFLQYLIINSYSYYNLSVDYTDMSALSIFTTNTNLFLE